MSILAGALAITEHCKELQCSPQEASDRLRAGLPNMGQYDYRRGLLLVIDLQWIERDDISQRWHDRLFHLVDTIVMVSPPPWRSLVPQGRSIALANMSKDDVKVLRDSGLLGNDERARKWWDKIAAEERKLVAGDLVAIGREGEMLSIAWERDRLRAEGFPDLDPEWSALEDNTLGYDIKSWDVSDNVVHGRMTIEVKASRTSPILIHISRSEWRYALVAGSHVFHVWDITCRRLKVLHATDIADHVPDNKGIGSWESFVMSVDV